jgi:hypothetical protein
MRWAERVACVRKMRTASNIWVQNLNGRDHSEDKGVVGARLTLKCVLRQLGLEAWIAVTHLIGSGCEHRGRPSSFIKCGEFLDCLGVLLGSQGGLCIMEFVIARSA